MGVALCGSQYRKTGGKLTASFFSFFLFAYPSFLWGCLLMLFRQLPFLIKLLANFFGGVVSRNPMSK